MATTDWQARSTEMLTSPSPDQKAALDAAPVPSAANPYVVVGDIPTVVATGTYTISPGAANVCNVALAITLPDGVTPYGPTLANVWLSDSSLGLGLSATAPTSFTVVVGAEMLDLANVKTTMQVQTDATGHLTVAITAAAKPLYYVGIQLMGGRRVVASRRLVAGDYG